MPNNFRLNRILSIKKRVENFCSIYARLDRYFDHIPIGSKHFLLCLKSLYIVSMYISVIDSFKIV